MVNDTLYGIQSGDLVDDGNLVITQYSKAVGTGKAITHGKWLGRKTDVSPNIWAQAGAADTSAPAFSNVTVFNPAGDNDPKVHVVIRGRVRSKCTSALQVSDLVMTDTNGDLTKYDGSATNKIKARYRGHPNETYPTPLLANEIGDFEIVTDQNNP